jgi:hypothetical protein
VQRKAGSEFDLRTPLVHISDPYVIGNGRMTCQKCDVKSRHVVCQLSGCFQRPALPYRCLTRSSRRWKTPLWGWPRTAASNSGRHVVMGNPLLYINALRTVLEWYTRKEHFFDTSFDLPSVLTLALISCFGNSHPCIKEFRFFLGRAGSCYIAFVFVLSICTEFRTNFPIKLTGSNDIHVVIGFVSCCGS